MEEYYADLHIHIGRAADGSPVKITASDKLNFANIAKEALYRKGLDLVGIIDCASPPVIADIEQLLQSGEMKELAEGGISYQNELIIIPGAEVESKEKNGGQAHYLAFFPYMDLIKEFSIIMDQYITNISLSSQATGLTGSQILQIVDSVGGILIPAHVFTPHKSFYGRCFSSFNEVFSKEEWDKIPAIELGLSADTELADYLSELKKKTFLSNSDAHSLPKIAREYNQIKLQSLNYKEFKLALENKDGRTITTNYGLDPRLGKYHRSFCSDCDQSFDREGAIMQCPICGNDGLVIGVKDRLMDIGDRVSNEKFTKRAPYIHQVPLADIPGIGPKTLGKLLKQFDTEMKVIHETNLTQLEEVVSREIAAKIIKARSGQLNIQPGGGGKYGKVMG